ncbi:MAG: DUF3616 domain-containing protein [Magnetococcales bacterium]|nr:DUF3616 domain-containing protein [Magnetococcales bacterium]
MGKKDNKDQKGQDEAKSPWAFSSLLPHEASGIVQLPDGRLLVVNDEADDALTLLTLNSSSTGYFLSNASHVRFSVPLSEKDLAGLMDLEGITLDGDNRKLYGITATGDLICFSAPADNSNETAWIGSTNVAGMLSKGYTPPSVGVYINIESIIKKAGGKINIEGIAYAKMGDPDSSSKLYLGLRNPLSGDKALIVELPIPGEESTTCNPAKIDNVWEIKLDGHGVRDMIPFGDGLLIISGAPEGGKSKDFRLWKCSKVGSALVPTEMEIAGFDKLNHAEGIAIIEHSGDDKIILVKDRSSELNDLTDPLKKIVKSELKELIKKLMLPGAFQVVPLGDLKNKAS